MDSEAPSFIDQTAAEGDSILTTATTATSKGRKGIKGKKAPAKGRKAKKEVVEVMLEPEAEPEDEEFEVKVDTPPKANRGKKRKSVEVDDAPALESMPKRRNTRARGSTAENSILEDSVTEADTNLSTKRSKAMPKKGRGSVRKSSRKASTMSIASTVQSEIPDDAEIEQKLLEDLEGPVTDDERQEASELPTRKATRSSKITKSNHPVFGIGAMDIDEAAIEAELEAMEVEFRPLPPLPKAKAVKGKQPRKPSAKQQAAAKKAAEAEAAAQKAAEEKEEASQHVVEKLEQSINVQQSSPVTLPKGPRHTSRQPALGGTNTSEISLDVIESNLSLGDDSHDIDTVMKSDSGNETDASVVSQSTVVRGGSKARRGSTLKKGKKGKKETSRNIEEIVRKEPEVTDAQDEIESSAKPSEEVQETEEDIHVDEAVEEETSTMSEALKHVPAPTPKTAKNRTRTGKAEPGPIPEAQETITMAPSPSPIRTRTLILPPKKAVKVQTPRAPSPSPPPNEATPTPSQSSDAENQPPSSKPSKPSDTVKKTAFATPGHSTHVALTTSTPQISPSKRNVIAGLQSEHPWTAVDLDLVFLKSPADENAPRRGAGLLDEALENAKTGNLTSPEKRMTVEEWIQHNASSAEEKFRNECERMVNVFEREGGRAMKALEGVITE